MQQGTIHGTTMLHATYCMQHFSCNNVACNNQHTRCNKVACNKFARNISTYTMQQSCRQQLHATLLHRVWWALNFPCNKVANNIVACNFVAPCMLIVARNIVAREYGTSVHFSDFQIICGCIRWIVESAMAIIATTRLFTIINKFEISLY